VTTLVAGVIQRQAETVPVAARPEATDRPLLKVGMNAPEVVDLRLELNLAGANPALSMGTVFDQGVRTAVVSFQQSVGLVPDGDVGPKTWGALDFIARDRVPQPSERDEMSARLTAALRAKRAGDFVGAAALLRGLDVAGNIPPEVRPSFLFPLAECEHHLGNFDDATRLYLEVVAAPGIDDETRRNASQRLREARLRQPPAKLETEISGERREALKEAGGPEATDRPLLKPGMDAPEVVDLRLELNLAGALPALSMGTLYDDRVLNAVLEFQRSTGLTPDGHVGPKTWGALDFIARDRIPDRAQREETSARFNAGLAAKRAGDLVGAAVIFRSLYSTQNIPPEVRPIFARALAECEHGLGNFDEAIALYLEFAAAPALDDTDRRVVTQRLREARLRQPPGKLESTISDERRQEFEREGRPEATDRPLLKPGMDAPEVVDLRLELNLAGANPAVPMGTFYDEQLRTAVLAFQRSAGLVQDGHVGPKTWGALDFIARDRIVSPAERDELTARLTAALLAKRAGDFVGAAALLRTLYRNPKLSPEIRVHFVFPLAECEQALGNFDDAISLYLELLAAPLIDDIHRRDAAQRLREARLRRPPAKLESTISDERKQAFIALPA
jgi:peptidoglycan hydrolase-like protein with peptidoglycan-binding domain